MKGHSLRSHKVQEHLQHRKALTTLIVYKKIIAKYIKVYTQKISAVALKQSLLLAQECCQVSVAMVTMSALTDEGNGVK